MTTQKNKTDKATARPWRVQHFEMNTGQLDGVRIVSAENGDTIADNETYYPHAITEANAELIVKAVNRDHLFDELESVLRKTYNELKSKTRVGESEEVLKLVESVLSKAERV